MACIMDKRNKKMSKLILTIGILIAAGFTVTGCSNTLEGVGQDVEKAGKKIQDAF